MSASGVVLILVVACVIWSVVSYVLLTAALDRRGVKTPFPFMGALLFRNLRRDSDLTDEETGRVGGLFWSYVVAINAALVLAVALLLSQALP